MQEKSYPLGAAASVLWTDYVSQDTGGMLNEAMSLLGESWMNHVNTAPAESFTLKGWGVAVDLDQMMT